ncbi:MAG: LytTR family DNA-binding domain-containing protein [Ignavibacteria bacterium]
MHSRKIKVIIIDDEILAREKIRNFLNAEKDIEISAECKDGTDAIKKINSLSPDLIFLDIHMPGMNGIELIESFKGEFSPVIIFTTAHHKYAIKAFELFALDYLLKPFDKERFQKSLSRARSHLQTKAPTEHNEKIISLLKELKSQKEPEPKYLDRMVIKSAGRIFFLKTEEIDHIEAAGNYLRVYSNNESHLIRDTMNSIEKKIDPSVFVRIQRSAIVNINSVKELKPWFHGEYLVYLKNGTKLVSGRTFKDNLRKIR